ncbi:MAG TPA: PilN domain-containing protein [Bradyrhizobium sp.]|nr:PilN domain-containing protein [Bradyrhizobium sp.]
MAIIPELKQTFGEWIAAVTTTVELAAEKFVRLRCIELDEAEDGTFSAKAIPGSRVSGKKAQLLPDLSFRIENGRPHPPLPPVWQTAFRGSRVEARLRADHVMASLLDFPSKAGDFLDGMIRAQIDRLTPWTVNDAVFGWSPPVAAANDRIDVTFAATSKQEVQPVLQLVQALDVASVAIYTIASDGAGAPVRIKLLDQPWRSVFGSAERIPRLLRAVLLGTGVAAAVLLLIATFLESSMQSEQDELQRQIAQRRAALRLDANATGSALGLLAKRKQTTPSAVMVLEAISRVLPDNTYVTELRIEGDKIQVVGMTKDAPSLIRLMEQSPQFTRATFFAPTTQAPNEPGERFHIEAHITAYFGSAT